MSQLYSIEYLYQCPECGTITTIDVYDITMGYPPKLSGKPENCYEGESPSFDVWEYPKHCINKDCIKFETEEFNQYGNIQSIALTRIALSLRLRNSIKQILSKRFMIIYFLEGN
jgi:hypothetical protein